MGAYLFSNYGGLFRSFIVALTQLFSVFYSKRFFKIIAVAMSQLFIILSLIVPYNAYASTASTIQTSYLGRLSNGYHNFKYTLTNSATGLSKSVTKAVSPASLGKVLKFVVSKRLGAFMALASVAGDLGYTYDDQDLPLYTPVLDNQTPRTVVQPSGTAAIVSTLPQICAAAFIQLQYSWSQYPITSYENCRWGSAKQGNVFLDLCYISATTGNPGCISRDISVGLAPSTVDVTPKRVPVDIPVDRVIPQAPTADRPKLADPTLVPSQVLPQEVKDAINELNDGVPDENKYNPPYVPGVSTGSGSVTGGYGEGAFDFEMPNFCTWAEPLCKLSDWFMQDDIPENEQRQIGEFDLSNAPKSQALNLPKNCPPNPSFILDLGLVSKSIDIPAEKFCSFLDQIRPFLIASSYLFSAWIIYSFRKS